MARFTCLDQGEAEGKHFFMMEIKGTFQINRMSGSTLCYKWSITSSGWVYPPPPCVFLWKNAHLHFQMRLGAGRINPLHSRREKMFTLDMLRWLKVKKVCSPSECATKHQCSNSGASYIQSDSALKMTQIPSSTLLKRGATLCQVCKGKVAYGKINYIYDKATTARHIPSV